MVAVKVGVFPCQEVQSAHVGMVLSSTVNFHLNFYASVFLRFVFVQGDICAHLFQFLIVLLNI